MGSFTRVMKRLGPSKNPISIAADPPIRAEAPQVNLPHVDTQLNMHQHTGLLDEAASNAQTQGTFEIPPHTFQAQAHILQTLTQPLPHNL
jgi:hypothetical protein